MAKKPAEIIKEMNVIRKYHKKTKDVIPKLKSTLNIERTDQLSLKSKY